MICRIAQPALLRKQYRSGIRSLGVGTVDWKKAVRLLKATGYDSNITLEVFCNDPDMQYKYLDMSRRLVLELWD